MTKRHKVGKYCWKVVPIDLLKVVARKLLSAKKKKKQYLKCSKVKNNKTRYVCINSVPLDKLLLIALFPYLLKNWWITCLTLLDTPS